MRKQVRKLRHWKQRFDRNAEFVFRRRLTWGNKTYEPGDVIPKELADSPTKLRRFWESRTIELAEFEDPNVATGQAESATPGDLPEGVTVESARGSWFLVTLPDGETKRVNGRKALSRLVEELREQEQPGGDETDATASSEDPVEVPDAERSEDDGWLDGGSNVEETALDETTPELHPV